MVRRKVVRCILLRGMAWSRGASICVRASILQRKMEAIVVRNPVM